MGQKVVIDTNLGQIEIELNSKKAPISAMNFLNYIKDGFYDGLIFHRVISNFMVQGGGFKPGMNQKEPNSPIKNEANNGLSNERGTIALARTAIVDSATCQFFINLKDNDFLNYQSDDPREYGYAVFGKVIGYGMAVVDKIAQVATHTVSSFENVPQEDVVINLIRMI